MFKTLAFVFSLLCSFACIGQEVTASQKLPTKIQLNTNYTIETTINKGKSKSFLMFSQPIPKGMQVSEMDSKGGRFKFADSILKITWIIPPAEDVFNISYQLVANKCAADAVNFEGSVYFIVDSAKKEFKLNRKEVNCEGAKPSVSEERVGIQSNSSPVKSTKEPMEIEKKIESKTNSVSVSKEKEKYNGVTFRIQIGAFKTKPSLSNVPELSSVDLGNGITKYFSGNYSTRDEAEAHRPSLLSNGFKGAFIVRFENGLIAK